MSSPQQTFDRVVDHMRDTAKLESALALLEWDEHTFIPSDAGMYRADQVSFLSGLIHQRRTLPELGQWLDELAQSELAADRHAQNGAAIAVGNAIMTDRFACPNR